jgi:DNA-binding beta-propeller fold protein YncE
MDSDTLIARYKVGGEITRGASTADGRTLFLADLEGSIVVLNLEAGTHHRILLPSGGSGLALNPAETKLYVAIPDRGLVVTVDLSTETIVRETVVAGVPDDVVFIESRNVVAVSNTGFYVGGHFGSWVDFIEP